MKAGQATKRINAAAKAVMSEAMNELCRDIPKKFKLDHENWDGVWNYSRTYLWCDEDKSVEVELHFGVNNECGYVEFSAWAINNVLGGDLTWKAADTDKLDIRKLIEKVQ